jgi:hypothetical protein
MTHTSQVIPPASPMPYPSGSPPRRGGFAAISGAITAVIATAGLVVGIIALNRPEPSPVSLTAPPSTPTADTTDADRALCTAVGPLLRERADTGKAFVNTGETGSPERDSAIPGFRDQIERWVGRVQPVLDANNGADPFMTRTLQRMVDDTLLYAESIRPGPATDYDKLAWNDAVVAYGGPFFKCHQLGVTW